MEPHLQNVPDLGPSVPRTHLLSTARVNRPALILVVAPPGYGKSVLASQLAASPRFFASKWVSFYDTEIRHDEWLSYVTLALEPLGADSSDMRSMMLSQSAGQHADAMLIIRKALSAYSGHPICLVLDGLETLGRPELLEEFASTLREITCNESQLVVTCRSVDYGSHVPNPHSVWAVGSSDLRLSRKEMLELVAQAELRGPADELVERVHERFLGHPALSSLMLRHSPLDDQGDPPQDLIWYVQRLIRTLPCESLGLLYSAAILRSGYIDELDCGRTGALTESDWLALESLRPLLSFGHGRGACQTAFRMHAVLCDAILQYAPASLGEREALSVRGGVISALRERGDFARLYSAISAACPPEEVAAWCETSGSQMLVALGSSSVDRCLAHISAARLSKSPSLMLLRAAVLREQERIDEALAHATIARSIAEIAGETATQVAALLLMARITVDAGDLSRVREVLTQLSHLDQGALDVTSRCLFDSYTAVIAANEGDLASAASACDRATERLARIDPRLPELLFAVSCLAAVQGLYRGRWDIAFALHRRVPERAISSPLQGMNWKANKASIMLEMGLPREARALLEEVLLDARDAGLPHLEACALGTQASVLGTLAEESDGLHEHEASQAILEQKGDVILAAGDLWNYAMVRRAHRRTEEALSMAETAVSRLLGSRTDSRLHICTAETEVAASMLALGDAWGARRIADRIRCELDGSGAGAHILRADLVLAEVERQWGKVDEAVRRMRPHAEYIATGSANWMIAMYVRAFPGLLGVLCEAIGADEIPVRARRLIPDETLDAAGEWGAVYERNEDRDVLPDLVPAPREAQVVHESHDWRGATHYVRLFGGFEVEGPLGPIPESLWRKRKPRLVFIMLVVKRGQDIPRDVILERLWPHMDEERAMRNFYVTWSTMKRALSGGEPPADSRELVSNAGGVCRITRLVRSDLDEFDEALRALRECAQREDRAGVRFASRRLAHVYRGDLLPGDIYEECFADIRERVKQDFCDAMVTAATVAESAGDPAEALLLLRDASAADPWREDIYQATMRCQMLAGQRSRAIETYLSCRSRLVDDLGIDPSVETNRLYQAVLAMEGDLESSQLAEPV